MVCMYVWSYYNRQFYTLYKPYSMSPYIRCFVVQFVGLSFCKNRGKLHFHLSEYLLSQSDPMGELLSAAAAVPLLMKI